MEDAERKRQYDLLNFLISRGFKADPVCGQQLIDFRTGETVVDPETGFIRFAVDREFAFFFAGEHNSGVGITPVVCLNCGHVMWFNTDVTVHDEDQQ